MIPCRSVSKKRGPGRPSFGIKERSVTFWAPDDLVEALARKAEKEGITAAEAWRRAARGWLNWGPSDYQKYQDAKEDEA